MATQSSSARTGEARQTVLVDTFTDGLLGPDVPMHTSWPTAGTSYGTPPPAAGGR